MAVEYVPYEGPVVTRDEAKAAGVKRYFSARPCSKGHIAERYVSTNQCLPCLKGWTSSWLQENADWVKARSQRYVGRYKDTQRAWIERNKEARSAYNRAFAKRYAKLYPERVAANCARWWARHPEMLQTYKKKYVAENPSYYAVARAKRKARKQSVDGAFSSKDVASLLKKQKGKCASCFHITIKKYHVDHKMPLCLGGSNGPENIQILCPTCNMRKGGRHPDVWARKNGRLL